MTTIEVNGPGGATGSGDNWGIRLDGNTITGVATPIERLS